MARLEELELALNRLVTPEYVEMTKDNQRMKGYRPDRYALFLVQLDSHSVDVSGTAWCSSAGWPAAGENFRRCAGRRPPPARTTAQESWSFQKSIPALPAELVVKWIAGIPARTFRWQP